MISLGDISWEMKHSLYVREKLCLDTDFCRAIMNLNLSFNKIENVYVVIFHHLIKERTKPYKRREVCSCHVGSLI